MDSRFQLRCTSPINKGLVIIGVAASDAHVTANKLLEVFLLEADFAVLNLGACTSCQEFIEAYQRFQGALAIAIGSLNGHAREDLKSLKILKQQYQVRCPIFLGGNLHLGSNRNVIAENQALCTALGADEFLSDFESLRIRLLSISGKKYSSGHVPYLW